MFRLKFYAAMFALVIGLLTAFNQTARAESWSWENLFSFGSSANAAAVCTTNPVVVNVLDSGAGSLRQAVIDACPGSTITFSNAGRGTISLVTWLIEIDKNLTIQGPGADLLTVRTGAFNVNSGVTATISGLTVADGGGIGNHGTLTVTDSVVRDNGAFGIHSPGNLTVTDSVVSGNVTYGIFSTGDLTVVNSVLSDNGNSGLIAYCIPTVLPGGDTNCQTPNKVTITNSTISHNYAESGGGIRISQSDVEITDSSITGNSANGRDSYEGGAGNLFGFGGAGIYNEGGKLTVTNTTIAGNEDVNFRCQSGPCPPGHGADGIVMKSKCSGGFGGDCYAGELNMINSTITDNIFNLSSRSFNIRNSIMNGVSCATGNTCNMTGNIIGADARLAPLGDYGGPTMTRPPLTGSPAINTGNTATSPAFDQRGAARVGTADIGAFEVNNLSNGGGFVAQLPDAFTEIVYRQLLVEDTTGFTYSLTGGALPTGISLSTTQSYRVLVSGRTAQTGVFDFSVTATDGTNSYVTDYRLRVLASGAPPHPGGCLSNPVVANNSDVGEGTLRQAVINACPGGTITFGEAARGRISLTTGPLEISKNLTIAGPGVDALTIRNGARYGYQNNVIYVNGGVTAVLSDLTVSDGYAEYGGGILNGGNLTVRNAVIRNNRALGAGAGIASAGGALTLVNSIVTGNGKAGAFGDGIQQGGGIALILSSATFTDSTVSGNIAEAGAGIYAFNSSVAMTNSTIGGNGTQFIGPGGGLYLVGGMATLTNCTVSQNNARENGGGINIIDEGTLTLINSTVTSNQVFFDNAPEGGVAFQTLTATETLTAPSMPEIRSSPGT